MNSPSTTSAHAGSPKPRRTVPLGPIDWLILAVAAALGVAAAVDADRELQWVMGLYASRQAPWSGTPEGILNVELPAKRVKAGFTSFLIVLSLGAGLVTFRRRGAIRPGRLPTPGVAATAAACGAFLAWSAWVVTMVTIRKLWFQMMIVYWRGNATLDVEAGIAAAIVGAWALLVLAGAWRPTADGRDMLGRYLGWCWLAQLGLEALFPAIWG